METVVSRTAGDTQKLTNEGSCPQIQPTVKKITVNGQEKSSGNISTNSTPEILASVSAAFINLHVGLILAYSAILLPALEKPDSDLTVTGSEASWIASIISLWAPVGSFIAGILMEWTGRVSTLHISLIPYLVGWIIIAISQNVYVLILGRCLCGFSMSMGANAANVYIAEVSRPAIRGSLMSIGSLFISLGMLTIYTIGFFIRDYRTQAWICVVLGLIPNIFILIFCSASPMWLVLRNRYDDALKSLKYLTRKDIRKEELANSKLKELIAEKELRERKNDTRSYAKKFLDTVRKPQTYKPFWILIVLFVLQQFSGLYIILIYAVNVFKDMGITLDPYSLTILLGIMRLLMGVVCTSALRYYGRRKLCIFSGFLMMISMFLSAYSVRSGIQEDDSFLKWIPVICIVVYISAGTFGLITIPWMISAEMFPNEVRGVIQGPVMAWANLVMFGAIKSYKSMPNVFGEIYNIHCFFGFMSLISIIFVWLFLPETHNRKLIEIEHYFRHNCCYITRNEEAERKFKLNNLI